MQQGRAIGLVMTPDNKTTTGWVIFASALGMMATLLSNDIRALKTWNEVFQPGFIADALAHFGTVVAAFVAGKIIPSNGDR